MAVRANPQGQTAGPRPVEIAPRLPYDAGAERGVLGAILLENHTLSAAVELLRVGDFFLEQHRRVFGCMITLAKRQRAIDLVTLADELERTGKMEAAGGPAYLAQLIDGVPRVAHIEHYAQIVKDKSEARRLAHLGEAITEAALSRDLEAARIHARAAIENAADGDWHSMFHTAEEMECAPKLSFAIEGFLQRDSATMIAGLSGHCKTLLMLSMSKALLRGPGYRLWNLFQVNEEDAQVVYLIPESALGPFAHRLKLFGLLEHVGKRLWVRTLTAGPTPGLTDPRILRAAEGRHVALDTAIRFIPPGADEKSASDLANALSTDIFRLLAAGARSVFGAHHSPKGFEKERLMTLENMLRGSGEIGAMVATAWGLRQIDRERNVVHIENLKARDFEPVGPFDLVGRPWIDQEGDFRVECNPGLCGRLAEVLRQANGGGAPAESREERARRVDIAREWLEEDPNQTVEQVRHRFREAGILISRSAAKNYRREALGG